MSCRFVQETQRTIGNYDRKKKSLKPLPSSKILLINVPDYLFDKYQFPTSTLRVFLFFIVCLISAHSFVFLVNQEFSFLKLSWFILFK